MFEASGNVDFRIYECECGFKANKTNEGKCLKCGAKVEESYRVTDDRKTIFVLTDEDVELVINENCSEELQERLAVYPYEEIMSVLNRKLELDWAEEIENTLDARFD